MTERNFYQVLGIRPDASQGDIRAAFVHLTKMHHPDATGSSSDLPWRLQDVQQAYRCLSVRELRDAHDAALEEAERIHFARQRAIQSRLNRFDRRHPQAMPRPYRRKRWRPIVLIALGIAALVALNLLA